MIPSIYRQAVACGWWWLTFCDWYIAIVHESWSLHHPLHLNRYGRCMLVLRMRCDLVGSLIAWLFFYVCSSPGFSFFFVYIRHWHCLKLHFRTETLLCVCGTSSFLIGRYRARNFVGQLRLCRPCWGLRKPLRSWLHVCPSFSSSLVRSLLLSSRIMSGSPMLWPKVLYGVEMISRQLSLLVLQKIDYGLN